MLYLRIQGCDFRTISRQSYDLKTNLRHRENTLNIVNITKYIKTSFIYVIL